jgi:hypothetical protein
MANIFPKVSRSPRILRLLAPLFLLTLVCHSHAQAQLSAYVTFTASELHEGPSGDDLYGGTAGVLLDGPKLRNKLLVSANLQVRDVNNGGERLAGVGIGPRVSLHLEKIGLTPYAEFVVGFARYRASNKPGAENTTDDQWQANAGVAKRITPRFDLVAEYSYSQYGANMSEYAPKSYSIGTIFHFTKR